MNAPLTPRLSRNMLWVCGAVLLILHFFNPDWKKKKVIKEDIIMYYSYVPAAFIYGDLSLRFAESNKLFDGVIWSGYTTPEGNHVMKYTCGLAVLYSPFFFLGHASAFLLDAPMDGYSRPYYFWLHLSSAAYALLGLILLRRLLLRWFSDGVTAAACVLMLFGTNLFWYTQGDAAMTHSYLFCLGVAFLLCTVRFYEKPGWGRMAAVAFLGGLITLVRPVDALIWLIFIFYGIYNDASLKAQVKFHLAHWSKYALIPVAMFICLLPQLLYWKALTGDWFFYSYGKEKFYWDDPAIFEVLFSFRKGWLVYTPVMIFAIAGMFMLQKRGREFFLSAWLFIPLIIYVVSCWWCWWYGGSFSQRALLDFYALLAVPLCAFLASIEGRIRLRRAGIAVGIALCALNVFQSWKYGIGVISYEGMTGKAWLKSFTATKPEEIWPYFKLPDNDKAVMGINRHD